ncbi:unnamed protein product, partial [Medioppia subpectinata]
MILMPVITSGCKRIVNYKDTDQISNRIVGGRDASIEQIPWMASLYVKNMGHCGATIIDERWILTAAHCLRPNVNKNDITVRIGSSDKLRGGRLLGVKAVYIHPEFNHIVMQSLQSISNDIALIELKTSIKYDMSSANRVCLPINAGLIDMYGFKALLSGWGRTDGNRPTNTLRKAIYDTIPNRECHLKTEKIICVNAIHNMACSGDSGSPLIRYQGCNAVLMGVYSSSRNFTGQACGPKHMVFVRVANHMPWIERYIGYKHQSKESTGSVGTSSVMPVITSGCKRIVNYEDTDQTSNRIVGGMDASIAEIPWMASLTIDKYKNVGYCGATIIDERWILTAAHCLHPRPHSPDYISNDMALIELKTSIKFDMSYANQVCLPTNVGLIDMYGFQALLSGWGRTDGDRPTNTLKKTLYKTIPNRQCDLKTEKIICINATHNMACD